MPFLEAIRLALSQIRAHKLKSFFTLLGVTIGVMFLIAVVAVINGMGRYMEEEFAGKLMGVNTFTLRHRPYFEMHTTDEEWRSYQRRPRIYRHDVEPVVAASMLGRARSSGLVDIRVVDLRNYAAGRHRNADDYQFGGGGGMALPLIDDAWKDALETFEEIPDGLSQKVVLKLAVKGFGVRLPDA